MVRSEKGTWSTNSKFLTLVLSLAVFLAGAVPSALAQRDPAVVSKLNELDARLASLEKDQKKILENQEAILKKMDILKIWIRRN